MYSKHYRYKIQNHVSDKNVLKACYEQGLIGIDTIFSNQNSYLPNKYFEKITVIN